VHSRRPTVHDCDFRRRGSTTHSNPSTKGVAVSQSRNLRGRRQRVFQRFQLPVQDLRGWESDPSSGKSRWGSSPDGSPAINAEFSRIGAVAADHAGDLYVVDTNTASGGVDNALVRRITPDGTITTVIDGLNTGSRANDVRLAVDGGNNLYVVDGSRIRKLSPDGRVVVVAGTGSETYSGDGGPAINAGLGLPMAIAADASGNIYITSDEFVDCGYLHGRVRVVSPDGIIKPYAGTGVDGYSGDGGPATAAQLGSWLPAIAVGSGGDLLIADSTNHAIRKITPDGTITSLETQDQSGCYLQGPGPYICAGDVAVDSAGRVYIVGQYNGLIQLLGADGSLTTVAGGGPGAIGDGGPATSAPLDTPLGIAVDGSHNVYIADVEHSRIRKVAPDGTITTVAGNGVARLPGDAVVDGGPAINAPLACASTPTCKGMAADAAGNFFFTDNDRVRRVSPDGVITTVANVFAGGLASDGKSLYIPDIYGARVLKLAPDGTLTTVAGNGTNGHSGDGGQALNAQLYLPVDIALDGAGNIYIAEYYETRIRKVSPDGTIVTIAGGGNLTGEGIPATSASLVPDVGIAADLAGNVYVAEYDTFDRIRKISTDGIITTIAGGLCRQSSSDPCIGYVGDGAPATSDQMWGPARLSIDTDGSVYVSDSGNNAVRVLRPIQ
jgi:trimeric autotransporter adhesin